MTSIFVNLPSSDLTRSRAFYEAIGCELNPQFSDERAICVVWSEHIFFMVLTREYFATFTAKPVVDPAESVQTLLAFDRESRADVDAVLAAGLAAGGTEPQEPRDHGFMFSRNLADPDGNVLEFVYMDPATFETEAASSDG